MAAGQDDARETNNLTIGLVAMDNMIRTYRFQGVRKYVLSSLVDSTLYFSAPPTLNDPHDCQIDIGAALTRGIQQTSGKRQILLREVEESGYVAKIQNDLPNMGVCCFSLELHNSLMKPRKRHRRR